VFPNAKIAAFDVGEHVVNLAAQHLDGCDFFCGDIYEISRKNKEFSLVVASEVLEHMEEPERALRELVRVSSNYVFVTVPNEPIWRILNMMRGKYLSRFGNTPGHVQHWSKRSFLKLISDIRGVRIVKVCRSLPWLLVLIEKCD
jgi:2-polyprenyl-3-methyl-5-hydroxy-6-metoxy-1,4-benzoquinol methylase